MADKKLVISQNPAPDSRFVVDVFDEKERLICYCGPYNNIDMLKCVDLFRAEGWRFDSLPEGYSNYA